jgi:organic radical activating enzyme
MKKIIKIQQQDESLMHLTWVINNICPNSCSYCPTSLHTGKNHHYEWENAKKFFQLLFKRYPSIHCSVSGGEPSVSPFFKEIIDIFHQAGHTVGLTSNAAKPVGYWRDISPKLNFICFSYHPEFPDANFIEKITEAGKHTLVTTRVMMHPKYWDNSVDMYNKLYSIENVYTESVRVLDWQGGSDASCSVYSSEQLDWLDNNPGNQNTKYLEHLHGRRVVNMIPNIYFNDNTVDEKPNTVDYINSGMTNFNGYECSVGLKSLYISYDGKIMLANCFINGSIGNINDPDNIQWPVGPVVCNKNLCHCTSDVNVDKRLI